MDGKVVGILGMYDDITEWKTAAEELKNRTKMLEKFNKIAVDRELRMVELKKEIRDLKTQVRSLE